MVSKKSKKVKLYNTKKKPIPESNVIAELQSKYDSIEETKIEEFTHLPLSQKTLKGLQESNYVKLTDIQKQSIGLALRGNDILGAAKTGSGKTLAFLVPVLEILYCKQWTRMDGIGCIIITPTRELAYQIYETLRKIGPYHDISAGLIIGGKDLQFEKRRMDQCNIIICTPGRLLQHMDENPLFNCVTMQILVLDEADRCLDMGFEATMNAIIENLPPERQTLLFSATQTRSVKDLARLSLKDPIYVSVHEHATHSTPDGLQQSYIVCPLEDKMSVLWSFIKNHMKKKIIVFFSSCKQVKYTFEAFCRLRPGLSLLALYGTLHQLRRMEIYETFCKKQNAVLFATDIAARGLDFPIVNWVVQMDCPEDVNAYIHRAGRTARLRNGGESLLMLLPSEIEMVERLRETKIPINMIKVNPEKLNSPHRKLEALLARDVSLKETAQRAFVAYIKSVFLMRDKKIFNVHALNTDAYAKSLGLAIPPRIRFLQRMQKTTNKSTNDKEVEKNVESAARNTVKPLKYVNDIGINDASEDDSDDEILTIKRKNVQIDDILTVDEKELAENTIKGKPVTKAAVAKKILRKKIVPNRKTTFDDEGQELIDCARSKVSEIARKYENEAEGGINIETAKEILREEDQFDKQRFREKVKQKHREEKAKRKTTKTKEVEQESEPSDAEGVESEEHESDQDINNPDTSWLPDPDKLYSKKKESDEESDKESDEESDEESDGKCSEGSSEEEQIHKPPKRKLIERGYEKSQKKLKTLAASKDTMLKADEELALQLLQN